MSAALLVFFIKSDSHPGQRWSGQYSQRGSGDYASDPDCCRPADPGHQSAGCCRLAAVSLTRRKMFFYGYTTAPSFVSMLGFSFFLCILNDLNVQIYLTLPVSLFSGIDSGPL